MPARVNAAASGPIRPYSSRRSSSLSAGVPDRGARAGFDPTTVRVQIGCAHVGNHVGPHVRCTLRRASDMDRPSPSGTPTSSGSPTSGAPVGAAREPVRSGRSARATPAPQRWARRLLWLILALAIAVGVGSRVFDSLRSPPAHTEVVPSVLYDRYGTPIAEIGPSVAHASLGLEDMAPALVDAIVAVLDPSFLERDGVDARSYADSLLRVWDEPDAPGDGSRSGDGIMRRYLDTVHDDDTGADAEARMLLAELRLGRQLSRPEILERFANVVYLAAAPTACMPPPLFGTASRRPISR